MITKGHDFPDITLVGIISADVGLNIPDFRAAERTFQLLTQVSGRGGRGENPGRVVIQTFNPEHYAIMRAKNHDYEGFYADELPMRKSLFYPPYSRILALHISAMDQQQGRRGAEKIGKLSKMLAGQTDGKEKIEIVGPAEAPIARIRGRFRWQILMKSRSVHMLHELTRAVLGKIREPQIQIKIDVDPLNFM
jgi:primosomal protein N' (replication factor Y)